MPQHSIAMSAVHHRDLSEHLLRADGQEDICLATYTVSTGANRISRLITGMELPRDGEREVHGNATITGAYVLRVASQAAREGRGVVMMHSHPGGHRWQQMSSPDADCRRRREWIWWECGRFGESLRRCASRTCAPKTCTP